MAETHLSTASGLRIGFCASLIPEALEKDCTEKVQQLSASFRCKMCLMSCAAPHSTISRMGSGVEPQAPSEALCEDRDAHTSASVTLSALCVSLALAPGVKHCSAAYAHCSSSCRHAVAVTVHDRCLSRCAHQYLGGAAHEFL